MTKEDEEIIKECAYKITKIILNIDILYGDKRKVAIIEYINEFNVWFRISLSPSKEGSLIIEE